VSVLERVLRLFPAGRRVQCEALPPRADAAGDVHAPAPEEIDAAHKAYRAAIHRNRNQMTISVQIARRMERISRTALNAADELVTEIQKARERVH
jgi:hypothetical protein